MIDQIIGIVAYVCILIPITLAIVGLIWFCIQLIKIYPKDND